MGIFIKIHGSNCDFFRWFPFMCCMYFQINYIYSFSKKREKLWSFINFFLSPFSTFFTSYIIFFYWKDGYDRERFLFPNGTINYNHTQKMFSNYNFDNVALLSDHMKSASWKIQHGYHVKSYTIYVIMASF